MKELLKDIIIAVVIALVVIQFIRPTIIKESSMEATLYENNYVFLSKQAYIFGEPSYEDIIVFKSTLVNEKGKQKLLIKRVIGLPGDTIEVKDNKLIRNGEEINEPYIKEPGVIPGEVNVTVPDGQLFVMGDNRRVSIDSRYEEVGCVDIDDVAGKAFFRLLPLKDMGKVS